MLGGLPVTSWNSAPKFGSAKAAYAASRSISTIESGVLGVMVIPSKKMPFEPPFCSVVMSLRSSLGTMSAMLNRSSGSEGSSALGRIGMLSFDAMAHGRNSPLSSQPGRRRWRK